MAIALGHDEERMRQVEEHLRLILSHKREQFEKECAPILHQLSEIERLRPPRPMMFYAPPGDASAPPEGASC